MLMPCCLTPPTPRPTPSLAPLPPGAGKTNVAMLCILHQLGLHRGAGGEIDKAAFKIVYIAPMKARGTGGGHMGMRACMGGVLRAQGVCAHKGGGCHQAPDPVVTSP